MRQSDESWSFSLFSWQKKTQRWAKQVCGGVGVVFKMAYVHSVDWQLLIKDCLHKQIKWMYCLQNPTNKVEFLQSVYSWFISLESDLTVCGCIYTVSHCFPAGSRFPFINHTFYHIKHKFWEFESHENAVSSDITFYIIAADSCSLVTSILYLPSMLKINSILLRSTCVLCFLS